MNKFKVKKIVYKINKIKQLFIISQMNGNRNNV